MVQAYTLVSATPLTEYSCGRRCDLSYLLGNTHTSSVFAFSQGLPAKAEAPTLQRWPVDAHQLALAPPTRDTSDDYYQAIYLSPRFRRADHKQWARPVNSASSHRQSPKRAPAQRLSKAPACPSQMSCHPSLSLSLLVSLRVPSMRLIASPLSISPTLSRHHQPQATATILLARPGEAEGPNRSPAVFSLLNESWEPLPILPIYLSAIASVWHGSLSLCNDLP